MDVAMRAFCCPSDALRRLTGQRCLFGLVAVGVCLPAVAGCTSLRPGWVTRSPDCHQLCDDSRSARAIGRDQEADSLLNAALRRRPRDHETRWRLAEELWSSGRQLAAAEVMARLAQDATTDVGVAVRLAEMELEIGRTQLAWEAIQKAFRIDPDNPAVLRVKAQLEARQGDWAAALATYHRLVQITPDDVQAVVALASLHLQRGQSDRAAPLLRAAVDHPFLTVEQRAEVQRLLSEAYAGSDRWNDAADCLVCALQQSPVVTAEDWYRLATIQARCGNLEAALASAAQSLRQRPGHAGALQLVNHLQHAATDGPSVIPADHLVGAVKPLNGERL